MWELGEVDLTPTPDEIQDVEEKEEVLQLARPLPCLPLSALERGTFCPCAGTPATAGFLAFFRQKWGKVCFGLLPFFPTGKICVAVQQPRAVGWAELLPVAAACGML